MKLFSSDLGFCSGNLCYKMDTGVVLPIGKSLVSANGKFKLKMQSDKNLVLYCYAGNAIWHASTYGKLHLTMHTDNSKLLDQPKNIL